MNGHKIFIALLIFLLAASGNKFLPAAEALLERQQKIAFAFVALEAVMLRMADLAALTNPQQAALLKRVHQESRQKLLALRLENARGAIQSRRLSDALEAQQQVIDDLVALLRLLESDDRPARRAAERAQWEERLRQLDDLIQHQRTLRANTARREKVTSLATEQQSLHTLAAEMLAQWTKDFNDAAQATEREPNVANPNATNPILAPLPRASEAMQSAEKFLQREAPTPAQAAQSDALAQLQQTRSELEKKLQQLRSEEKLEQLKWLATRLNFMLTREKEVRDALAAWQNSLSENAPSDNRAQQIYRARLATEQGLILAEAQSTIFLLREEGSAPVITETLQQIAYDMTTLREHLQWSELDAITHANACGIIGVLEEILAAVGQMRQAQEEERRANANQDGADSQSEKQTQLVQMITELKIIQAMQTRVNKRTKSCEEMRQANDFDAVKLAEKLEELARQQAAISRLLHTIQSGRNQ